MNQKPAAEYGVHLMQLTVRLCDMDKDMDLDMDTDTRSLDVGKSVSFFLSLSQQSSVESPNWLLGRHQKRHLAVVGEREAPH